jgi:hypothetical protein
MLAGAVYDFALSFVFMIAGYSSSCVSISAEINVARLR